MLGKLLKYDSKDIYKFMTIFYSLSIFFAILTRIFMSIENSFVCYIIGKICLGTTISMIANIIINNVIRLWVRFKSSLYGDESYLTHTLPISKKTIYLSKTILSIVTMFTSCVVIILSLFISLYSKENMEILKTFLNTTMAGFDMTVGSMIGLMLILIFLELFNALQCGYFGILQGCKRESAKVGYSFIYAFIAYMLVQGFGIACIAVVGIFNSDVLKLFTTSNIASFEILETLFYAAIVFYTVSIVIMYLLNNKIFSKGVNVE